MAITLSPKPSDGPLNGQAASAQILVTIGAAVGNVGGVIKIPGKPTIEVPVQRLLQGRNRVTIPLPPGGLPPNSELRIVVSELSGNESTAIYKFQ